MTNNIQPRVNSPSKKFERGEYTKKILNNVGGGGKLALDIFGKFLRVWVDNDSHLKVQGARKTVNDKERKIGEVKLLPGLHIARSSKGKERGDLSDKATPVHNTDEK